MEKKKDISSLIAKLFILLLSLSLLSMWLLGNMYARYTTTASGGDGARVAAYVFQLQDGADSTVLSLDKIHKPGDQQTYTFTVTNKRDSLISEVAQEYSIKLEINGSMPLTCQLKKKDTEDESTTEDSDETETADMTEGADTQESGSSNAEQGNQLLLEVSSIVTDLSTTTSGTASQTTTAVSLPAAEEYTQTYILTAEWPESYNDEKYASASATSAVTLTVAAQQLD